MVVRENFDNKLQQLQTLMERMSDLAISSLENSFEALKTKDVDLALKVIENDAEVDELEIEINQFITLLIVKEQPVATDLRKIIGALKISSEIERISDFGVNIAKATIKIGNSQSIVDITNLEKMKDVSITMLKKGVQSFIESDINIAKEVAELDDEVDKYNKETYKVFTNYLKEHPEETDHLVQLLMINRFLERTADHITNIAENAAYLIKGKMYDFNS